MQTKNHLFISTCFVSLRQESIRLGNELETVTKNYKLEVKYGLTLQLFSYCIWGFLYVAIFIAVFSSPSLPSRFYNYRFPFSFFCSLENIDL